MLPLLWAPQQAPQQGQTENGFVSHYHSKPPAHPALIHGSLANRALSVFQNSARQCPRTGERHSCPFV